jgi:molybdopterin synthase catalytic subunit
MTFSHPTQPIFRTKQQHLDVQDLEGLLKIHWKIGNITLFQGFIRELTKLVYSGASLP